MAQITLRGNPINTVGDLPAVGAQAPAFTLTGTDLGDLASSQFDGKKALVLNIFPSIDTPVCATSVRTFNERAAATGAPVVNISKDLPFALKRFCGGAEGIENAVAASAFRSSFGEDFGITITDGPMAGLLGPRGRGGRRRRQGGLHRAGPPRSVKNPTTTPQSPRLVDARSPATAPPSRSERLFPSHVTPRYRSSTPRYRGVMLSAQSPGPSSRPNYNDGKA